MRCADGCCLSLARILMVRRDPFAMIAKPIKLRTYSGQLQVRIVVGYGRLVLQYRCHRSFTIAIGPSFIRPSHHRRSARGRLTGPYVARLARSEPAEKQSSRARRESRARRAERGKGVLASQVEIECFDH